MLQSARFESPSAVAAQIEVSSHAIDYDQVILSSDSDNDAESNAAVPDRSDILFLEGPSIYDVRKIWGFFDPLPPLSAFGTGLQN